MTAPYVRLGRIVKHHGAHGEVSVAVRDGLPESCLNAPELWIVPPPSSGAVPRRATGVRQGPKGLLVSFTRLDGREDPQGTDLAGRWLLARGVDVPVVPAARDDLIGREVDDAARGLLGVVTDVIVTGANDVLVVEGDRFGQVLIPVIPDVVRDVPPPPAPIAVVLLDGLIDGDAS